MSGLQMKYFVLKPAGDNKYAEASRKALRAYAKHIQDENQELCTELREWADSETFALPPEWHSWPKGKIVEVNDIGGHWCLARFFGVNEDGQPITYSGAIWDEIREPLSQEKWLEEMDGQPK